MTNNSLFDLRVMLLAGFVGLFFRWLAVPAAPFLIGFILGPLLENSFREALLQSDGDVSVFYTSPISLFFWLLSMLSIFFIVRGRKSKRTLAQIAESEV